MIYLNPGATNSVVLTLKERTTISGTVSYIFQLISDQTNKELIFTANDISLNTQRYDEFEWATVGSTASQDLNNGVIYLSNYGFYTYNVFETATYSTLSITGLDLVETGRLTFLPVPVTNSTSLINKYTTKNI